MLCGYLSVHLSGKEIQKRRDMCIRRADSFCCRVETNMTFKASICCLVTQSCPTLSDPMNHSMPGFLVLHHLPEFAQTHVHGPGDATQLSSDVCQVTSVVSDSLRRYGLLPIRLLCQRAFSGKNTRVGCHALLQGIVPTQGSNPCL